MTFREAVIQAYLELGVSREEAELKAKASDAFLPDIAPLTGSPVKPGLERQFIEELKMIYRKMKEHSEAVQAAVRPKMGRRLKMS